MCITDAVLLLWVTVAQICMYAMWRGNRSWTVVITLAVMIGLAGLTKGPVILGIQGTTLLALGFLYLIDLFFPPLSDGAEILNATTPRRSASAIFGF